MSTIIESNAFRAFQQQASEQIASVAEKINPESFLGRAHVHEWLERAQEELSGQAPDTFSPGMAVARTLQAANKIRLEKFSVTDVLEHAVFLAGHPNGVYERFLELLSDTPKELLGDLGHAMSAANTAMHHIHRRRVAEDEAIPKISIDGNPEDQLAQGFSAFADHTLGLPGTNVMTARTAIETAIGHITTIIAQARFAQQTLEVTGQNESARPDLNVNFTDQQREDLGEAFIRGMEFRRRRNSEHDATPAATMEREIITPLEHAEQLLALSGELHRETPLVTRLSAYIDTTRGR